MKFTPAGGKIQASLTRRNNRLYLSVQDSGPGIHRGLEGDVFTRFQRQCCLEDGRFGIGLGMVLFRGFLINIYSSDPAVIEVGMTRMVVMCSLYFTCGLMDMMVGCIRGMGYSVMPTVVSLLGACGVRVLWVATVFQIPAFHQVTTVYWSYPISWFLTIIANICCYVWASKRLKRRIEEEKQLRT